MKYDETFSESEIAQLNHLDAIIRSRIEMGFPISKLMQERDVVIGKAMAKEKVALK